MAAVDISLEVRRFKPEDRDDRRRVLTGYGRFAEIPEEIVVELSADGTEYTAQGGKREVSARDLHAAILAVLPDQARACPRRSCTRNYPRNGDRAGATSARRSRGRRGQRVDVRRKGQSPRPFRYWRVTTF